MLWRVLSGIKPNPREACTIEKHKFILWSTHNKVIRKWYPHMCSNCSWSSSLWDQRVNLFNIAWWEVRRKNPQYIGSFDGDTKNLDGNWLQQLSHPTPSNIPWLCVFQISRAFYKQARYLVGSIFLPNPMCYALCLLFFSPLIERGSRISYIICINFVAYTHHSVKGNDYKNKGAAH